MTTAALPPSAQTERQILATAIEHADAAGVLLDPAVLMSTDFTVGEHPRVYTALRSVHAAGLHGLVALQMELERRGWHDTALYVLEEVVPSLGWTPSSADVATWVKTLQAYRESQRKLHAIKDAMYALDKGNLHEAQKALNGAVLNGAVPAYHTPAPPISSDAPELPDEATAIYDHMAGCAPWLDGYIEFARTAAPMTPYAFHEAAGLVAASIAVARRLVIYPSTTAIYPNLFMLFVADSTIYSKTTGMRVLGDLFRHAGLEYLMLPQRMTPEAFVQELGTSIPSTLANWDEAARADWLNERAVAAQRGWILDEASRLFDSFKRDFNTGLLPLMLDLYECPARTTEQTIGRGRILVNDAYLSFFGAATPAGMNDHLQNRALWTNGLWARFILVVPDEQLPFTFFPPALEYPSALLSGIRRLAHLFPMPTAEIVTANDSGGREQQAVAVRGQEAAHQAQLGTGVWPAWEAYTKATRHTLLLSGGVPGPLQASYGRLGMQAIKIALLLAALDTEELPVRVELRHFARAQMIVERWRSMLHQIYGEGTVTEEAQQSDKVLAMLAKAGEAGLLARDIYRPLNMAAADARAILEELEKGGQAERLQAKAANGRNIEVWRLVVAGTKHATGSGIVS